MFEFLQTAYDRETDRSGRLFERVSLAAGFLVLLGTGITTLHSVYPVDLAEYPYLDGLFLLTLLVSTGSFIVAVAYILRSSAKVYLFANTNDPLATWKEYQSWIGYSKNDAVLDKPDVKAMFRESLSEQLAKAASHNRRVTELRNNLLQVAIRSGLIAGLFLIAPTTCFVIKKYLDADEGPVRVEIVNPIKVENER